MGKDLLMLDERIDPVTKQILQNVVKRKNKFELMKKKHLFWLSCTMVFTFCYFLYLFKTVVTPYSYSFAAMFTAFVDDILNVFFLMITMGTYGLMNVFRQKMDKAEKEFHALRCEIIDKSKELWKKEDAWANRHLVFEMMKKNFDINLYHENK